MTEIQEFVQYIKITLKSNAPDLTPEQIQRRDRILNSEDPDFMAYGLKISEIEEIVKESKINYEYTFDQAIEIFKELMPSHVHEEKFAGIFLLNLYKRNFKKEVIKVFHDSFIKYCDSWSICDSTMIRVIGPFLGKKQNKELAIKTINKWYESSNMWIRRGSMVILLKLIMIKKEFDEKYVFALVEKMLKFKEDYIQKGIGWLLKTCSKYEPELIYNYLNEHKKELSRLILRYASEKLPKDKRAQIL